MNHCNEQFKSCQIGRFPSKIPDDHLRRFCQVISDEEWFCEDIAEFRKNIRCQYSGHEISKY